MQTLDVNQGLLVYRVHTEQPITVALNAAQEPADVTVELGTTGHLESEASHREGDSIHLDPGGWYIAGAELSQGQP